ncbi:EZH inhibitory protein isoform X2 [Accipiter gentilis]|nr:EZH inhibitory protein isoform X2 [Accipiter gentilis]
MALGPSCRSPPLQSSGPSTDREMALGPSCRSPPLHSSGPSTDREMALGPSSSSPALQSSGPSSDRQMGLGPSCRSPPLQSSGPSTDREMALGPSCRSPPLQSSGPSSDRQMGLGLFQGSPVPARSSCSSHPGPDRIQYRSRLERRAQKPYSWPGNHRRTSPVPAPSAESSALGTASQLALGPSCRSPALQSSGPSSDRQMALGLLQGSPVPARSSCSSHPGPDRIRYRSRLERRAQKPYSRPGNHRRTGPVPAPRAQSSALGTASQLALGPSCRSPALPSSGPSTDRRMALGLFQGSPVPARSSCSSHPGPDRIRYRSRLERRAQKPYSRPGRRC